MSDNDNISTELNECSSSRLLEMHSEIGDILRARKVVRSANNPVGDLSEFLFCKTFNWIQENNSKKSIDATDKISGKTYQIKGRRLASKNNSRQLSSLRNLNDKSFDYLAGIIFNENYSIHKAIIIPVSYIIKNSTYRDHTNSHIFQLRDTVWEDTSTTDVTDDLKETFEKYLKTKFV